MRKDYIERDYIEKNYMEKDYIEKNFMEKDYTTQKENYIMKKQLKIIKTIIL